MDKIQLIKQMCAENPENAELKYLLGIEYKDAGLFKDAIITFSEALKNAEGQMFGKIVKEITEVNLKKEIGEQPDNTQQDNTQAPGKLANGDSCQNLEEANNPDTVMNLNGEQIEHEIGNLRVLKGGITSKNKDSDREDGPSVVKFNDVGGLDNLKDTIKMKIVKPFLTPGLFEKFKKKSGGGLLLFGPPGCGKTFIAKATAGECSAVFKPVYITDVLDPYFGQSAINIKDIFSVARAQKPCILFFDEIDTIGFNRAKTSTDTMRSVVDQLLSEIDGIDANTDRILVIGATNMPWDVDPALRRPGRFDKTIFVPPPDIMAREVIFQLKMKGKPCANIDYKQLARESELFSGADIENVVETATENVLEEILATGNERPIRQEDLLQALKSLKPSTLEWLRTISNYVRYANQSRIYDDVESYLSKHKKYL